MPRASLCYRSCPGAAGAAPHTGRAVGHSRCSPRAEKGAEVGWAPSWLPSLASALAASHLFPPLAPTQSRFQPLPHSPQQLESSWLHRFSLKRAQKTNKQNKSKPQQWIRTPSCPVPSLPGQSLVAASHPLRPQHLFQFPALLSGDCN